MAFAPPPPPKRPEGKARLEVLMPKPADKRKHCSGFYVVHRSERAWKKTVAALFRGGVENMCRVKTETGSDTVISTDYIKDHVLPRSQYIVFFGTPPASAGLRPADAAAAVARSSSKHEEDDAETVGGDAATVVPVWNMCAMAFVMYKQFPRVIAHLPGETLMYVDVICSGIGMRMGRALFSELETMAARIKVRTLALRAATQELIPVYQRMGYERAYNPWEAQDTAEARAALALVDVNAVDPEGLPSEGFWMSKRVMAPGHMSSL